MIRIEFDAARNVVNLMVGNECVDQMTLGEYREIFGFRACSVLLRGDDRQPDPRLDLVDPRD